MAKQKSEIEDLLFTFGIDSGAGDIFQNYMDKIANRKLRAYQEIIPIWRESWRIALSPHSQRNLCSGAITSDIES